MSILRTAIATVVATSTMLSTSSVADAASAREIPSAFVVAKSSNKNQVHYAVRVNEATCAPEGASPVHPYWRMFEKSADATEALEDREERVLGVSLQAVDGSSVRIVVRALPTRPITIHTWRNPDGTCGSSTNITISGANALLHDVYVKQKLFGVDYLMLNGSTDDGASIHERVTL